MDFEKPDHRFGYNEVFVLMRRDRDGRDQPISVYRNKHVAELKVREGTYVFGPVQMHDTPDEGLPYYPEKDPPFGGKMVKDPPVFVPEKPPFGDVTRKPFPPKGFDDDFDDK